MLKENVNYENGRSIKFICSKCKITEFIPTEIVEMLDAMNSVEKDLSYPPRFDCEHCNRKMVSVHYISVNRTVNTYKK